MNKSVLMSYSPYWYYLIMEGIKTIEVRKTLPKDPHWNRQVECYMTKDKKSFARIPKEFQEKYRAHMGKVGMHFRCDMSLSLDYGDSIKTSEYGTHSIWDADIEKWIDWDLDTTFIATIDLINYLDGKGAHFLQISDLKIYDTPKELGEFRKPCDSAPEALCYPDNCYFCAWNTVCRPPQSWMYIEER